MSKSQRGDSRCGSDAGLFSRTKTSNCGFITSAVEARPRTVGRKNTQLASPRCFTVHFFSPSETVGLPALDLTERATRVTPPRSALRQVILLPFVLEPSVVDEHICGILFRGHCHPPVEFRQLLSGRTDQAAISFGRVMSGLVMVRRGSKAFAPEAGWRR